MANIFTQLFRPKPALRDIDQNDWAMTFQGQTYPLFGRGNGLNPDSEAIGNDFLGVINGAYKASGALFACCLARQLIFQDARFAYQRLNDGKAGDLFTTNQLRILDRPWPNGTTADLLGRMLQDGDLGGNSYIVREGDRLRRLRPDWTEILLTAPPEEAVSSDVAGYVYKPGATRDPKKWKIYPIDGSEGQVSHWAPVPDPEATYRGMSWITPIVTEIEGDINANRHKNKFYANAATPNLAVALKETVTAEQFEDFIEAVERKTGVDNAYSTLYLGGGADVTVLGRDFRQLDFKATQGAGETRIAAAARIPAAIVGFSEGLGSSHFRNEGEGNAVKDLFASMTLRPLWRSVAATLQVLVPEMDSARLWWDESDVSFLTHDRSMVAKIQQDQASTISQLIMQGYTPESVVKAVSENGDWRLLEHTGLYSVQLQPPMPDGPEATEVLPTDPKAPNANTPAKDQAGDKAAKPVPPAKAKPAAPPAKAN